MLKKLVFFVLCLLSLSIKAEEETLLVLGDSLSAGYGIAVQNGWVSLLQDRLDAQGYNYRVVNASISGDTTRGARARLEGLLTEVRADIAIIELGGNDGLRGISIDEMYDNFSAMIREFKKSDTTILLVPMQLPPNYGPVYTNKFMQTYDELAQSEQVFMTKFILEGIADNPALMQSDGIHPKASAQPMMLDNVWPGLEPLLKN